MSFLFPVFSVSVSVPIAIAVTIPIAVSVSMVAGVHPVEDEGHVAELVLAVQLLHVGQLAAVEPSGAHHEDGEVADAVADGGVGHDTHRHVVGDDVVIAPAQLRHQLVQAAVHEQLGGVGRHGAGGDDVEVVVPGVGMYDVVHTDAVVGKEVGHARRVLVEVAAQGALADVEVHQHHLLLREHEAHGEVAGDERLSGALVERGEGDDLHRSVLLGHECHVGAQDAEALGEHPVLTVLGDARAGGLPVLWDFPEEGYADRSLEVPAAVHPGVHEEYHEEHHAGHCQPDEHPEQQDAVAHGRDGSSGSVHAVDGARVVVGHSLREGVLLAPVEQEHVERLLDFLLALDGEHLALLGGHGGEARLCLRLAAAGVVALHVDADDHVVDGADDALPQGVYGVVQLLHHGVAVAAVVDELVALELQGVVLADLPLDAGVADARPRGDEVALPGGVGEVVLDEPRQPELGLLLLRVGAVGLLLARVASGQRADVHHLVVLLERLQLGLHAAQLALDDDEPLVDELGGVHRHLVLVVDGLLVIYVDQRVEHVLGAPGRGVLQREHEDGGLVLLLPDAHAALEPPGHGVQRVLGDAYLAARPRLAPVVGAGHQDALVTDFSVSLSRTS